MSWPTVKFFDSDELKDPDTQQPFDKLKDITITCCTCGRGQMLFGDGEGKMHILSSLREMLSYQAYELRVHIVYQLKQRNIFVTVGDDEDLQPLIKVWNCDKRDKSGSPGMARSIRVSVPGAKTQCSVTAICAHENTNIMAVGFKDGSVLLLKGNITRDRISKNRVIHRELEPGVHITGLGFKPVDPNVVLMYSTNRAVYSYVIGENAEGGKETEVALGGCELNCCTLADHTQDHNFVVAKGETIYFATPSVLGQCLVFDGAGEKVMLRWYRGYLIVVATGGKMSRHVSSSVPGAKDPMTIFIYDVQNKFAAYQFTYPCRVIDVLSEWGCIIVLLRDGKIYRLEEIDTKTKIDTLFKKNLYPIAISLAKSHSYSDGLVDIFIQYGDHLYSKGDYEGAINQYILTIGQLEPSYVIRKFLDTQKINNLTSYLKALHERGMANADHTTLLLNCYTKLRDNDQLDKFISEDQTAFEVETAIKVCRQANNHKYALKLAEKYKQHDWYLRIQLEDENQHLETVKYICKLSFKDALRATKLYGKALMQVVPDDTTALISRLCTDWVPDGTPAHPSSGRTWVYANTADFIQVFMGDKKRLTSFLEAQIAIRPSQNEVVYNTLLELYLMEWSTCVVREEKVAKERRALELLKKSDATYDLDHALVLVQLHNFSAGILYLYEKSELFQQILLYHMEQQDPKSVMETCIRNCTRDVNLWVQALSFFASKEEYKPWVGEALKNIEKDQLLPPLLVMQTLAESPFATLNDIKPFIVKHLQEENEQIAKDETLVRQYRENTAKMREQIKELQTTAKIFQVMKCSLCKRGLTLPAVHFLCQHSFHRECHQEEYENECQICAKENRKVLDYIQKQGEQTNLHENFHAQLQRSADGFSVVADYFGRGVFSNKGAAGGGAQK